jgi:hypothetical protein
MSITQHVCPEISASGRGRRRRLQIASMASLAALVGAGCSMSREEVASQPVASETAASSDDGENDDGANREGRCRPRSPIFWQTHPNAWPVTSLTLGGTSYAQAQLLTILRAPPDDDASIVLGRQLIATLLDVASGTDPTPVSATIADANALFEAGTIPLGVPLFSALGLRMLVDAAILDDFTDGRLTRACAAPVGSCEAWSEVSALPTGHDVVAYVAKGDWFAGTPTGIAVVNVEGTRVVPTLVPTRDTVNTCASNPLTGRTVCTANGTDVYLLSGTTLQATLTSAGSGFIPFPGGNCTNCGVTMDAIHDRAVIGLAFAGGTPGFQVLDLGSSSFEPPFATEVSPFTNSISTGALVDPFRNFIVSPTERGLFELVDITATTSPKFFEQQVGEAESAGEDCTTGITVFPEGPILGPPPQLTFGITDLTQATFTPGSPGSWASPFQRITIAESKHSGWGAAAVAQGTHTAILAGEEIENDNVVAVALPPTSGSGTPAPVDWIACDMPIFTGNQPQTTTAYKSPNDGHAMAVVVDAHAATMAVIDLTKMLDPAVVPRTAAGHGCAAGTLPASVIRLVSLP